MPYKSCAALLCNNNTRRIKQQHKHVLFHGFPPDCELTRQWITFCKQDPKWRPTKCHAICSEHFKAEDYQLDKSVWSNNRHYLRVLKSTAVPSVECIQTSHIKKKHLEEDRTHKRNVLYKLATDTEIECSQTSPLNRKQPEEDSTPADSELTVNIENLYDPLENAHQSKLNEAEEVIKALEAEQKKLIAVNVELRVRFDEIKDENDILKEESKRIKKELENNGRVNSDCEN
ncbi:THAP domain-containing protein 5-like [Anopheles albimanus]|uniref:Uncharacterized protein n=1 Tax=Anopheles albimanus TaxID=7167 RepID=A0A182FYE3_ANOAL|nr:THAP domain-containing protein 5-like [Anopheles albimanus]